MGILPYARVCVDASPPSCAHRHVAAHVVPAWSLRGGLEEPHGRTRIAMACARRWQQGGAEEGGNSVGPAAPHGAPPKWRSACMDTETCSADAWGGVSISVVRSEAGPRPCSARLAAWARLSRVRLWGVAESEGRRRFAKLGAGHWRCLWNLRAAVAVERVGELARTWLEEYDPWAP